MFTGLFANGKSRAKIAEGNTPSVTSDTFDADITPNTELETSAIDSKADVKRSQKVQSPIVGVLGAKGGVGCTTIAINLAAALSIAHKPITLVDGNLQQPEIAYTLGKEPKHSLLELLSRMPNADRQMFEACNVEIAGADLGLLSPPLHGEALGQTNLTLVSQCLKSIRSYSNVWVIDLPRHLDKHLVNLTDMCDKIMLVFEATVTGVAATQRWLSIFRQLGYEDSRIVCLLNRAGSKYKGVEQQLVDCFGDTPILSLPNASSATWDCSARGATIVEAYPNHPYSRATLKVAEYISQSILSAAG